MYGFLVVFGIYLNSDSLILTNSYGFVSVKNGKKKKKKGIEHSNEQSKIVINLIIWRSLKVLYARNTLINWPITIKKYNNNNNNNFSASSFPIRQLQY